MQKCLKFVAFCFDFFLFACLLCFESRTRLVSWCRGGSGAFSFCLFLAWYTIHPVTPSPPSPPPLCLPLLMFRSWGGSGAFLFYFSISFSLPDTYRGWRGGESKAFRTMLKNCIICRVGHPVCFKLYKLSSLSSRNPTHSSIK